MRLYDSGLFSPRAFVALLGGFVFLALYLLLFLHAHCTRPSIPSTPITPLPIDSFTNPHANYARVG